MPETLELEVVWRGDLHREIPPPPPYRLPDYSHLSPPSQHVRRGYRSPVSIKAKLLRILQERGSLTVRELRAITKHKTHGIEVALYHLRKEGRVERVSLDGRIARYGAA